LITDLIQRGEASLAYCLSFVSLPNADTESYVPQHKAWQTLLAASSHVDQLMTVAAGGASVSARVAVILETSARVYQHRITVTQLFLNICRLQQQPQQKHTGSDKQNIVYRLPAVACR